jgi:hypothetical protein
MTNIAIFISGRLLGFREFLLPYVNMIKNKYNIYLFFSINTFSLDKNDTVESVTNDLKNTFGEMIGDIYFEEFKMPRSYVENRISNNVDTFSYNCLSCFYNDRKNMELIENFEINKNIQFDIVCKTRTDIKFIKIDDFIVDKKDDVIIRNKHMMDIRYWGHIYINTPLMISDAFAYGNKKSMKHYCETYDWILKNDLLLKGQYTHAFEIFLTDSLLQHVCYNVPGGGYHPILTREQIINNYLNNPKGITFVYMNNIHYVLLTQSIRSKNNFVVDKNNVFNYTHLHR